MHTCYNVHKQLKDRQHRNEEVWQKKTKADFIR